MISPTICPVAVRLVFADQIFSFVTVSPFSASVGIILPLMQIVLYMYAGTPSYPVFQYKDGVPVCASVSVDFIEQ